MATFIISNPQTSFTFGAYEAEDEQGALDAMARDAGYADFAAACEVTGEADELIVERVQP